jgi:esterase/lipase superfamily enzyme
MFVVTNRVIGKGKTLSAFGDRPSPLGPNELRLVEVNKVNKKWQLSAIPDTLSKDEVERLIADYHLDIDPNIPWHGSLAVACKVFAEAKASNKSILFFTHGYNNDVKDVLTTAELLEQLYDVIVIPFTWPANGGGAISGTASYLSDKADARASSGAFNRFVGKVHYFHTLLAQANLNAIKAQVEHKYAGKDNPMAASALYTELMNKACKIKINLLCHSMGNYLLKHSLMTSDNVTSKLVFDNINLVAADTNNKNHAGWIEKLDVRNRVHIVINENDSALRASRIKPGNEQLTRLGHYLKGLNSVNAVYIDVTDADEVDSEHSYFKDTPVRKNAALKALFKDIFTGNSVEKRLMYFPAENYFKL